jgi:hypothetical protein
MSTPEIDKEIAAIDKQLAKTQAELAANQKTTLGGGPVWWSTTNAMTMSASVLLFGFLVICIAAWLIRGGRATSASILRVFGTILILVMAVFLVVAGYSDQQVAPVLGLLGTIAGYLLGRETAPRNQPATTATTTTGLPAVPASATGTTSTGTGTTTQTTP